MEVVICCPSVTTITSVGSPLLPVKPIKRRGKNSAVSDEEDDSELLAEPLGLCRKQISSAPGSKRAASSLGKRIKFDNLIKQKIISDVVMKSLNQIENKEAEITTSVLEITQHKDLSSNSELAKAQLHKELQSDDHIYVATLAKYNIKSSFSEGLSPEASSFGSLSLLNHQSDWKSVRARLLLSSSARYIPKNILSGMDFYAWLKDGIFQHGEASCFITKLACSGSILRLPLFEKTVLLDFQRALINPLVWSSFKSDFYAKPLDSRENLFLSEFYAPITLFKKMDHIHHDHFCNINNPELLANFTLYLQSHIHIIDYILELNRLPKFSNCKFIDFITDKPRTPLAAAKNELVSFLKALARRLKPGSFIPLQETILNYESLLLK